MSAHSDRHSVRRVVLPSGKTIEVVYFEDRPVPARSTPAATPSPDPAGLHVCPRCASELVQPLDWSEAGPSHWEMTLGCPDCEWSADGVFSQELVDSFEEELDRGAQALARDFKRLSHANMEDGIDRFVRALQDDHVLPMDF